MALACVNAHAQTAPPPAFPDPLAPKLATDPRTPPTFRKFDQPAQAQLGPPPTFTPPASGAGDTGFDSTNSRKAKTKAAPKTAPKAKAKTGADAQASVPAVPPISPYQKPPPGSPSATDALARAPGQPPVDDIGPIRKPLKKRKAHSEPEDPYAPLGIRSGGFLYFPAIELIGGYSTNPQNSQNPSGASLYSVAPELRMQSDWSRHEFKADLRGSYTGYSPDTEPTLSRPTFDGKAEGRIDVTRDTRIDSTARVLVSTDNPGSPNLQAGLSTLPIYSTFGGSLGLGHRFNRFDLSVKGDVQRTAYQDSQLTDGSTASNADRNYNQYAGTLRGGYELSPGVTPFAEFTADQRVHDLDTDPNGYQRNSQGLTGRLGTTFELSRLLTGEASIGYTQRAYDDARFSDLTGLIGDASLIWTANPLTTVKFSAKSSVGESSIAGVSGVLYREVGVQVDHAFRYWLIGSVKGGFGLDSYQGVSSSTVTTTVCGCVTTSTTTSAVDREDQRVWLGAALTYKVDRNWHLKGEFRQEWVTSNVMGNDYSASTFLIGVRWQR